MFTKDLDNKTIWLGGKPVIESDSDLTDFVISALNHAADCGLYSSDLTNQARLAYARHLSKKP